MIYNYTSAQRVVSKIFTDLNLQEESHRVSDMIEWIGEALEKIGAYSQYIPKVTGKENLPFLVLENYQAQLPSDLHEIVQVAYASDSVGPFYAMRYATGSYERNMNNTDETLDVNTTNTRTYDFVYSIVDGYIKTNVKDGYIMIAYLASPTDSEGYPLVPNKESFLEALYWYVNMKLKYIEWAQGRLPRDVYYHAESKWRFYRGQAYGEAMMLNTDQLESMKNQWLKLVPELDAHNTFFSTVGQRELVYNQTQSTNHILNW